MPAPRRAHASRGASGRLAPRVLTVAVSLAGLVGVLAWVLGSYVLGSHQQEAGPGPTAVPLEAGSTLDAASSASPSVSISALPSATPVAPSSTSAPATTTKPPATRTTAARTTTTAAGASSLEQQVFTLTNAQRAANGCPALVWNATLAAVARAHSQDMASKNYFDHNSPDGTTPAQRVRAAGYAYTLTAENIAAGQATPQAVMASWMSSAGHKANIINCSLKELGVGFATGGAYGTYWTQDFGAR